MIYEVVLQQRYYDQLIVNRWNYQSFGTAVGATGSFALITALGAIATAGEFPASTMFEAIRALQSNQVTFVSVLCKAIREAPTDFYDNAYPTGVVGNVDGQVGLSPTMAYGFRTNRTRTDIRRGSKRIVGATEEAVIGGGVILEAALAGLETLADEMSAELSYTGGGSSLTFEPIIVQKRKFTEDGKVKYAYYNTIAEQLEHVMDGIVWTPFDTIRTQTSRQYGHGA